jgi:choline dehydrogenase-like flavoprotein
MFGALGSAASQQNSTLASVSESRRLALRQTRAAGSDVLSRRSVTLLWRIPAKGIVGDDAMHTVDYIALGFLIACMLLAGAKVLHKAP